MGLLKKLTFAFVIGIASIATAPVVMAGKIENATPAEVSEAIDNTIRLSEETLEAIKAGVKLDAVLDLFRETKQESKRIESNPVDRLRQKANSRMKKSRSAFKKGEIEKATALATEGVETFKQVKKKYHSF